MDHGRPDLRAGGHARVKFTTAWPPNDRLHVSTFGRSLPDKEYLLATDASAFRVCWLYGGARMFGAKAAWSV